MNSDFHLFMDLSADASADRTERMAAAIETGLRHCATDPLVRLKMILGETYAEYMEVVGKLRDKLAAESEAGRALAETMACDIAILEGAVNNSRIAAIQQDLLAAALNPPGDGQ